MDGFSLASSNFFLSSNSHCRIEQQIKNPTITADATVKHNVWNGSSLLLSQTAYDIKTDADPRALQTEQYELSLDLSFAVMAISAKSA